MTTGGPWSVKGIDPKAREIAKDLARRSGMTLGEWLNHMIVEGGDEPGADTETLERSWLDAPRTRSAAGGFSATESLRARLNRDVGGRDVSGRGFEARDYPPRDYGVGHNSEAGELQRIGKALAELSQRLESTESRSTLAISGIDQAFTGVLGRIEGAEREQTSVAARFDTSIEEVRAGQSKLNDRLRRFDGDEAARMEAIKSLEGALTKVAGQIYEGESRARTQMSELREDVSALARRVDRTDMGGDSPAERRLEALAADLTARVEQVRAEVSGRVQEQSDGKLDRLEGAIRDIATKVSDSEKRSSEAVDRMGREVMRVAQAMSSRVQAVESRSAKASDQMGSEMARIAEAMEGRMRRADAAQAESLEKLGGEIARIAEKLAERISQSERRSSGAITHMGDQLSGVTDAFNARHEKSSADIAERIRMSEERTAKLLAETRESIDRRLADTYGRSEGYIAPAAASAPPPVASAPAAAPPAFAGAALGSDPFGGAGLTESFGSTFAGEPFGGESFGAAPAALAFDDFPAEQPFETAPEFAPAALGHSPFAAHSGDPLGDLPEIDPPRRGTRDLIASARAAARQASESRGRRTAPTADPFADAAPSPAYGAEAFGAAEFTAPDPVDAAADRARTGVLGFGFPLPKRKKKEGPTLKTMLMASGVAAALSVTAVGAVGLVALDGRTEPKQEAREAPTAAPKPELLAQATEQPPLDQTAEAPVATPAGDAAFNRISDVAEDGTAAAKPTPTAKAPVAKVPAIAPAAAPAVLPAAVAGSPRLLYAASVHQIETGDVSGVEGVRKAANLGYAPAEFYLAKLFESGSSGVRKDPAEARRWTERAAQTGDAKAMHNLALYWFEGAGGPKDPAQAAEWFKKAAQLGVQDSQYNLARLYEQGFGVAKNPAEAYKWYLVAGTAGDAESKAGAEAVKRQLAPETQTASERAAQAFRAQIAATQMRTAEAK